MAIGETPMVDDKQFEVRIMVNARDAAQAAGKILIGPNRQNQVFVTDLDDPLGAEIAYMLNERGDAKVVKPDIDQALSGNNLNDPNAGAV